MLRQISLGVDFGTNNVRALAVDCQSGEEIATSVADYRSGRGGIISDPSDPNVARQNPADYIQGFIESVSEVVRQIDPLEIVGVGIDTTASTPIPVDKTGTPLAMCERFQGRLDACAWLWKDHSAHQESEEITDKAKSAERPYLNRCGGSYSSEWFWSKILRCKRVAPDVFEAAESWLEQADFIPAWVTGNQIPGTFVRSVCASGHKAMAEVSWGGYPDEDFLGSIDPALVPLRRRLTEPHRTSDQAAGDVTRDVSRLTGLPEGIPVAVGIIDAHAGALGSGVRPGRLVKILGTSTCDIAVIPHLEHVPEIEGLSGIVPGSVIPGMLGLEAGQPAVGDLFGWFSRDIARLSLRDLEREAAKLRPGECGLIALDWNNGNRSVLANPLLSGLLVGQTLQTTSAEVYRALIESTAFGALTIVSRIEACGIEIDSISVCGGIAQKSPLIMQVYADICRRPLQLVSSDQACALGAAICGAMVGKAHRTIPLAQDAMAAKTGKTFPPDPTSTGIYQTLYDMYLSLHQAFGHGQLVDFGGFMGRLREIQQIARRTS